MKLQLERIQWAESLIIFLFHLDLQLIEWLGVYEFS